MFKKALLILLLLVAPTLAQRPVTHEDIWLFNRLSGPKVSPDGVWAVVPVTEPAYKKEEQRSDLWLIRCDGSQKPRRLTGTRGPEGGLVWGPKGDRLAFTAKREKDENSQIYLLDMTGPGEAQRVTDFPLDCSNPVFSPDGRSLLFEARVYPGETTVKAQKEAVKKEKDRQENVSDYVGFPIRHWDHWLDKRRVRLFVLKLGTQEEPRDLLKDSDLVKKPGFAGVATLSSETLQATFSPDGAEVVFAATTNRDQAVKTRTSYRLFRIPASGGQATEIPGPPGSLGDPRFGSDGKLYSLHEESGPYVYNLTQLRVQDWPQPDAGSQVTQGFDLSVADYALSERGAFVSAVVHGRKMVYEARPGQKTAPLNANARGVTDQLSYGGGKLLARYENSVSGPEIVRLDRGIARPLTSFNKARSEQLDWRPFQEFWFTSAKGRKIHNWVVLPPKFDETRKYPLVLFIHGGPHSSSLDKGHVRWSAQLMAAGGYVVLLTDYTGSVGYGAEFARAIQGDPMVTPGQELLQAVEEAIARYPYIDGTRVAAAGASYGGHMVNWLQATSDRFKCLVGHAGLISLEGQWSTSDAVAHRELNNGGVPWEGSPLWKGQSPHTYAGNFKTPVLLTIGEKDYRVPLNQTLAAWTYLQRMGVPSKLLVYHQANHWIMSGPDARHFWTEVHAWLAQHLTGG